MEGDRLFLLRQGLEPRGIVGSGWAISDVFDDWHWEEAKRAAGQRAWCLEMDFDVLLDADREPILPRARLNEGILGQMYWDSQSSGVLIPEAVAKQLEREWKQLANYQLPITNHVCFKVHARPRADFCTDQDHLATSEIGRAHV